MCRIMLFLIRDWLPRDTVSRMGACSGVGARKRCVAVQIHCGRRCDREFDRVAKKVVRRMCWAVCVVGYALSGGTREILLRRV
jgi:hypothetical protein